MTLQGILFDYVRCAEVPGPGSWLADAERAELARWQAPQRRAQFLAGRLAAKQLVRRLLGRHTLDLSAIEIHSQDARGRGTPPAIRVGGQPLPWRLSIAHTERGALAAATLSPRVAVGVDLVRGDWDPRGLIRFWCTPAEQAWMARNPRYSPAAVWAAKEAAYKAAGGGEPFRPRQVEILLLSSGRFAARRRGSPPWPPLEIRVEALDGHMAAVALAATVAPAQGGNHD